MADSDSKPYGLIYCALHRESGKRYIGQTTGTIKYRWGKHCGSGRQCRVLSSAIKKHGADAFDVFQIDIAHSKRELDEKEIFHISYFKSDNREYGYNIAPGGAVGKHAKETCELIAAALRGKPLKDAHRAKLSASHMGRKRSEESRRKQSASATGKKRPERTAEHAAKLGAARLGKKFGPMSDEHKAKIGAANKGRVLGPMTDEQKTMRSDAMRGKPKDWSSEGRERTLQASREYWAKYRLEKAR